MKSFPTYEVYQDTGEEWIGQIPNHWQFLRTKNIFRLVAEPAPSDNDEELLSVYSDIGVKPRRELEQRGNKASTTDGYWLVKKGDVIVNKLLAWMGAIGVSDYDGVTSPAYDILRSYKPVDSKFYHYLFRNPICTRKFKQHSKGIMEVRLRLYFDELGNIKIPYPPFEEQRRIVEFLDRKTAEIDDAIATKQRLIELLQEQKAILINQAVTKGLDPNVPMCDRGTDWLGQVPEHWKVGRLKILMKKMDQGWSPQCSNYPANDDQWGIVKVGCVNGYQFNPLENKTLPPNLNPISDLEIKHHDILISRANTLDLV
ncbi:MAG: restriction endonuclease subunit S, partial [Cyanobacteria bacterium P01_D01_bin.56]